MRVRFKCTWMGILPGQVVDMEPSTASQLMIRGTVEEVRPQTKKQIKKSPRDKMMRGDRTK